MTKWAAEPVTGSAALSSGAQSGEVEAGSPLDCATN